MPTEYEGPLPSNTLTLYCVLYCSALRSGRLPFIVLCFQRTCFYLFSLKHLSICSNLLPFPPFILRVTKSNHNPFLAIVPTQLLILMSKILLSPFESSQFMLVISLCHRWSLRFFEASDSRYLGFWGWACFTSLPPSCSHWDNPLCSLRQRFNAVKSTEQPYLPGWEGRALCQVLCAAILPLHLPRLALYMKRLVLN